MGLPIRELQRGLEAEVDDWVWPGDDAVDLEASDLEEWAREGGTAGLVLRPEGRATRITLGPLGDRAYSRVMEAMRDGDPTYLHEACRYGVRRVSGPVPMRLGRHRGVPGLSDADLDALGECRFPVPWVPLHRAMMAAMGGEVDPGLDASQRAETALPTAYGMAVLARTFRLRRGGT